MTASTLSSSLKTTRDPREGRSPCAPAVLPQELVLWRERKNWKKRYKIFLGPRTVPSALSHFFFSCAEVEGEHFRLATDGEGKDVKY